ncbi:carbohydrate ABC transporter permease [Streptomyces sp. NPDC087908]|uniref:carbohydrate ABC transporter permease n=1 Tax=unclassified Streptomyces TaxID=2593676 RepID=UPI0011CDBD8E|nr:sugar ABC transporter permease [Streptomyces sp. adm13(2018)]TXS09817.1 sugar ABC transporter permease [Streptomyces sp. adm13(2018)]
MTLLSTRATAAPPPRPRARFRLRKEALVGWGFAGPFVAVFGLVFLAPIGYAGYLSLFQDRLIGGTSFVGLDNYGEALKDPRFWDGLMRVGLFLLVQVPIMLGIALLAALAIDSGRLYGKTFFRVSIFLPYAVPAVVASLIWGFMYGDQFGLVGNINEALGVSLPNPLSPSLVLASIGNIVTWEFVGYNMLIFYSALKVVPRSLYEAAAIDGAGEWRIVASVKLPAIRSALVIATIFSIIGSFQLFNEPSILQKLAPNAITNDLTPNLYTYSLSFSGQQHNYAATVAIVMGVITAIIAYAVQLRGMRKG